MARCLACGVYFTPNAVAAVGQERLFYEEIDEARYRGYFEPFRKRQYREVLRSLNAAPGASLLDVGASYGWMVEVALELGFDAYGLEPGEAPPAPGVAPRIARASLETFARDRTRAYDVVTLWHVLEHLEAPLAGLETIAGLVAPGGRLVVAVPNNEGRLFRIASALERLGLKSLIGELFYWDNPNMHVFYYGPRSLALLLESSGFTPARTATMESFDWPAMHRRMTRPAMRLMMRAAGPFLAASRLTARENLVIDARRR